ncbi:zinc ribbon-containing (seleno)protein DG [Thiovibrio sp. JS02]
MIDPELKYCPKCRDEYRADIIQCAHCAIPLIMGSEFRGIEQQRRSHLHNRKGALTPDDELIVIHQAGLADSRHLQALLEAERIGTLLAGDDKGCGKKSCGPPKFYLQVRREDVAPALEIVQEEYRRTTGLDGHAATGADAVFDPEAGEAVCPACGFTFATTTTVCPDCGLCLG